MGALAEVGFYRDGSLVTTDDTSPYTYTYANATAGTYDFQVVATDDDGGTSTSNTVRVTVNEPPNVGPSVSLVASSTAIDEGESVTLTATASDTDGSIVRVAFYRGRDRGGERDHIPLHLHLRGGRAGHSQDFYAVAEDDDGATATSETVEVAVNALPTVSITASSVSIDEGESVTFTATASDSDGSIVKVAFYRNGVHVATDTTSSFTHTYTNAAAGTHAYYAVATDDEGASKTSSTVEVAVNAGPTVTLSASSSAVIEGNSVTLTATASDTDGSIASVKFYGNGALLLTETTSPYTYTYANAAIGIYSFQAVATDDDGVATSSNTVVVMVIETPNVAPTVSITVSSSSINEGESVTVTALASDLDGIIASLRFYRDDSLVAITTSAPYTYTYTNATGGDPSLLCGGRRRRRSGRRLEPRGGLGERSAGGLAQRFERSYH